MEFEGPVPRTKSSDLGVGVRSRKETRYFLGIQKLYSDPAEWVQMYRCSCASILGLYYLGGEIQGFKDELMDILKSDLSGVTMAVT